MSLDIRSPLVWIAVTLVAVAGCTSPDSDPDAAEPGESAGLTAYCETRDEGPDLEFWHLIERACETSGEVDSEQAQALRAELADLPAEQVADFHRTLARLNQELDSSALTEIADDLCLPDIGLGDDLNTDYRTWIIAHGQVAYEAVQERPETLRDFPDAAQGCAHGEIFGAAAVVVYDEKAGPDAEELPALDAAPGD